MRLKLKVQTQRRHKNGAAIAIVAWVFHILKTEGRVGTAPGVQGVISFEGIFTAIVEMTVAQEKPQASERKVLLMVAGNSIGDEGQASAIKLPAPTPAIGAEAELDGSVDLGVGVGLVASLVPAPAFVCQATDCRSAPCPLSASGCARQRPVRRRRRFARQP